MSEGGWQSRTTACSVRRTTERTNRQTGHVDNIGVSVLCPAWVKTDIRNTHALRPSGEAPSASAASNADVQASVNAVKAGIGPDVVAEYTADCIEAERFFIFTHPEMQPFLNMRNDIIAADYAACAADPRFAKVAAE